MGLGITAVTQQRDQMPRELGLQGWDMRLPLGTAVSSVQAKLLILVSPVLPTQSPLGLILGLRQG